MLLSGIGPDAFDRNVTLKKINVSALRASMQIRGLLELAGISGHSDGMSQISLDGCLDRVRLDLELVIAEKNAVIVHGTLGNIQGIPIQIEQLLNNLIGNAIKFSKGGNSRINISTRAVGPLEPGADSPLDPNGKYVCLEVSDNGIGFEQRFAEQIFDIFFRLGEDTGHPGSGIGLAICKKIVDNHNGHIMAKSQKGEGSVFSVYLKG